MSKRVINGIAQDCNAISNRHCATKNKTLNNKRGNKMSRTETRVIGAGSYGCVIMPPIPCESSLRSVSGSRRKSIGKIMWTADIHSEIESTRVLTSILETIDPDENMVIYKPQFCPRIKIPENVRNNRKCAGMFNEAEDRRFGMLSYAYGGETLNSINIKFYEKELVFSSVESTHEFVCNIINQLVKTIMILHSHGIVHSDLHGANILIDEANHVRLIDLGLSTYIPDALSRDDEGLNIYHDLDYIKNYIHKPLVSPESILAAGSYMLIHEIRAGGSEYIKNVRIDKISKAMEEAINKYTKMRKQKENGIAKICFDVEHSKKVGYLMKLFEPMVPLKQTMKTIIHEAVRRDIKELSRYYTMFRKLQDWWLFLLDLLMILYTSGLLPLFSDILIETLRRDKIRDLSVYATIVDKLNLDTDAEYVFVDNDT